MKLWLEFLEGEYQWEQLVGRDAGPTLFWLVHRHLTSLQPLSSHPSWDIGATCLDMAAEVSLAEGGYNNVRAEMVVDHQWVLSGCVSWSQEPGGQPAGQELSPGLVVSVLCFAVAMDLLFLLSILALALKLHYVEFGVTRAKVSGHEGQTFFSSS